MTKRELLEKLSLFTDDLDIYVGDYGKEMEIRYVIDEKGYGFTVIRPLGEAPKEEGRIL